MDVRIRRATVDDADAIGSCVEDAYRHYVARLGKAPGPMLEDYRQAIRQHDAFVAEDHDGKVVGALVLVTSAERLLLDNVAVFKHAQGRGVGRALLRFAEAEATRRGWPAIELYTHELMHENIAMYERCGYRETERRSEKGYARVYMRKPIDAGTPHETLSPRSPFAVHPTLLADCHRMGVLDTTHLLLHRDSALAWFILVPHTPHRILLALEATELSRLMSHCRAVTRFVLDTLGYPHVNFASIGNVVPQLHLHVVGRRPGDACWPRPVWGHLGEPVPYGREALEWMRDAVVRVTGARPSP